MKYFFFFCSFWLSSWTLWAQPSLEWATNIVPTSEIKYDKSLKAVYVMSASSHWAGNTPYPETTPGALQDSAHGPADVYLSKFDTLGNRLWATFFGGNGKELQMKTAVGTGGRSL